MKKIVAILLVVALMSAMFVVPAHAHEAEETEIVPRSIWCDYCGGPTVQRTSSKVIRDWYDVDGCTNDPLTHKHKITEYYTWYICTTYGCKAYNNNNYQQHKTTRTITSCASSH